ncbi:MAG: hypothetical protein IJU82_00135, partial [Ruminiclostridium sp.]|nr:hypothetical protein [Ruminiclostridium sp.]
MAQLKKILAGAMALCMAGSVLTACGGSSDSSSSGSDAGTADAGTTDAGKTEVKDVEPAKTDDLVNTGKKYNIYCWNTEFKERFEKYYEGAKDTALWDGVEINWVINPNDNN